MSLHTDRQAGFGTSDAILREIERMTSTELKREYLRAMERGDRANGFMLAREAERRGWMGPNLTQWRSGGEA